MRKSYVKDRIRYVVRTETIEAPDGTATTRIDVKWFPQQKAMREWNRKVVESPYTFHLRVE